jgi:hypothetical protein
MITEPPKIDKRTFSSLAGTLLSMAPHYSPEWSAGEKDAATALAKIHAFITEMVITRLNQVPRKGLIAFLDMLGIKLLPARPSLVPITFKITQGTEHDVLVPPRTQASAAKTDEHDEVPFETEKNLLAVASRLKEVISVDPGTDAIYVHTPDVVASDGSIREQQAAFSLFSGIDQQEHSLYLGQKDLLNIKGKGEISLSVTAPTAPGAAQIDVVWEYWGEDKEKKADRWIALEVKDDATDGLRQSGKIVLYKGLEGEIKEAKLKDIFSATGRVAIRDEVIAEMKNRWIRGRLASPLSGALCSKFATIDTIFLKTAPAGPVAVEAGFFNDVPLDFARETIEAHVARCHSPGPTLELVVLSESSTETLYLDTVEKFMEGDVVQILRGGSVLTEATIESIAAGSETITVSFSGSYTCMPGDTVRTKAEVAMVAPFGTQPKLYDAFYVGSKEALSKKGAKISLTFSLWIDDRSAGLVPAPEPKLAWEYWDGRGWQALTIIRDDAHDFMNASSDTGDMKNIDFICPQGIAETEVFGQKNYWIRTRIIGGDYGREQYKLDPVDKTTITVQRMFKIPVIRDLTARYSFDESIEPEACLSYNNLDFEDMTTQAVTANLAFSPYVPLPDSEKALYLGFDRQLMGGPICIFFDADELQYRQESKPEIEWRFRSGQGWSVLDCLDETEGFVVQGLLELIGPSGFTAAAIFDAGLYWLRGGLTKGDYQTPPLLRGIFPNTTWAVQAETIRNEILGSGNGQPGQTLSFFKFPVLDAEEVRVQEVLSEEERQTLIAAYGQEAVVETPGATGRETETWVLWHEVTDFFGSAEKSRHYMIDRATGQISFGDGVRGMVPPAGQDNIKAFSYQTGGGRKGNVYAREVKSLKSAVSGVEKVMNPIAADGGADTATVEEMIGIGPAIISHRYRAVTAEDFECLARLATRKVAKARCLANRNSNGKPEAGWVTVVIIPDSPADKPYPSLTLKKQVREYLEGHSLVAISSAGHLHVDGPIYAEMNVAVDLFVASPDVASEAAREAKQRLDRFFHPLVGGPEGQGWEFGRGVAVSDIYALLEGIDEVEHIENLLLEGTDDEDFVPIPPDALVCNGTHTLNIRLKGGI